MRAERTSIVLDYRWREWGTEWEDVSERVLLTSTSCTYGGQRRWFICPHCCRYCHNLAYESQREDRCGRLLRKVQSIRSRLGGSTYLADPFPPKPKGMHGTTYRRLQREAEEAECKADVYFLETVHRFYRSTLRLLRPK